MLYDKGNIIVKKDIVFKDNNTPDPKGKHPAMITIAVTEDKQFMYFLTLTSQTYKYFLSLEFEKQYYLLKSTEENKLRKTSLVNLQNIYKYPVEENRIVAFVQLSEYNKLILKLIEWQKTTKKQDEFFDEIEPLLLDELNARN